MSKQRNFSQKEISDVLDMVDTNGDGKVITYKHIRK